MNMINNIKYAFLPVVMFTMATFTSCEEDIEIGNKIDESSYLASTQLSGLLLDENTNKNSSVIELRNNEYSTNVVFRLLQSPNQKIPDRKTKCVIKTHINIKQNVIFCAKLKPV